MTVMFRQLEGVQQLSTGWWAAAAQSDDQLVCGRGRSVSPCAYLHLLLEGSSLGRDGARLETLLQI